LATAEKRERGEANTMHLIFLGQGIEVEKRNMHT